MIAQFSMEVNKIKIPSDLNEYRMEKDTNLNYRLYGLCAIQDNFYTGITMRSFLEHDVTPLDTLKESWRTLNPGGILVIKAPNFACLNRKVRGKNWCGLRFPDHVSYFTPQTLTGMVEKAGFSIRKFNFFDKIPTSDNMWLIAEKP